MSIDYFTPESFDVERYNSEYLEPIPPRPWWMPPRPGGEGFRKAVRPVSYDDRQFFVPQCMSALAGEGEASRHNIERLIRKLRGKADMVDPEVEEGLKTGIPDPDIGWNLNPNLCTAEAARLRHMADYLEARLENYPEVEVPVDSG